MSDLVGIGKAAEPFSKGTVGLLRRLFGPAADELGEMLADRVRAYKAKNLSRIVEPIGEISDPENVLELPLRFAIPFLEHASREDHIILQEMWSNLLKDAAKGVDEEHHLILHVLSSLTPNSVALLEYIVDDFHENEHWDQEIDWQEDWIADVSRFLVKEIEPTLFYEEGKERSDRDVTQELFEFQTGKPNWIFQADLPLYMPDLVEAVEGGDDAENYGTVFMGRSLESPPLQILERELLVSRRTVEIPLTYAKAKLTYAVATKLGVELVATCKPDSEGRIE